VAVAVVAQIVMVSTFGVLMGGLITYLLSLAIPASVPILLGGQTVGIAMAALLAIGPLGGLVTVRLAVAVEPLTALGLSS
jgi:putative ABC transport system permease protein